MQIKDIKNPKFIKNMDIEELNSLSKDLREFLIDKVSKSGGHLASNLGIVEITLALHYVFDSYKDKFLFDVGHQTYIHKILTGRADKFDTLRKYKGISGFQKRNESIHDHYEAGHSSTSLSTSLGMAIARDLNNEDNNIISIIGDGSLMSGMSLEALNNIGLSNHKVIIILNDNGMSINPNISTLSKAFSNFCSSDYYNNFKKIIKNYVKKGKHGENVIDSIHNFKKSIKNFIINPTFFDDFNIEYFGPIDGHNIEELINVFKLAKENKKSCVIHCITTKGKGYKYSENDKLGEWHGVPPFDIESGEFLINKDLTSYSEVVSNTLHRLMEKDKDIICITPAMATGSKLINIFKDYKDRSIDTGITEDHAMCLASGLSLSNKKPFISIYSSFLQRAYDQINHDIARMNLNVVVGIDRAGIVGEDGETHHGIFDISLLTSLPNIILCEGKDQEQLQNLIYTGFKNNNPFFIRYPKNSVKYIQNKVFKEIKIGKWEFILNNDNRACIISYGDTITSLKALVDKKKIKIDIVNAIYLKPIDNNMLKNILHKYKYIFVVTKDIIKGGLGDTILEVANSYNIKPFIKIYGINDKYVGQGTIKELEKELEIDEESILKDIKRELNAKKSKH